MAAGPISARACDAALAAVGVTQGADQVGDGIPGRRADLAERPAASFWMRRRGSRKHSRSARDGRRRLRPDHAQGGGGEEADVVVGVIQCSGSARGGPFSPPAAP